MVSRDSSKPFSARYEVPHLSISRIVQTFFDAAATVNTLLLSLFRGRFFCRYFLWLLGRSALSSPTQDLGRCLSFFGSRFCGGDLRRCVMYYGRVEEGLIFNFLVKVFKRDRGVKRVACFLIIRRRQRNPTQLHFLIFGEAELLHLLVLEEILSLGD